MDETNVTNSVYCRGPCNDPYCPECNSAILDDEINSPVCPYCGCLLDWKIYHMIKEVKR